MSISTISSIGISNPTVSSQAATAVSPATTAATVTGTSAAGTSSSASTSAAMAAQQVLGSSHVTSSTSTKSTAVAAAATATSKTAKPTKTLAQITKPIDKRHKWHGGKYDCWGLSDRLYKDMSKSGYKVRVIQFSTPYASNHRQVQYQSNGKWTNFPYDKYKFDKLFRENHVPSHFKVLKHN